MEPCLRRRKQRACKQRQKEYDTDAAEGDRQDEDVKMKVKMTKMIKKNIKLEKSNRRDSTIQKNLEVTTVLNSQWINRKVTNQSENRLN